VYYASHPLELPDVDPPWLTAEVREIIKVKKDYPNWKWKMFIEQFLSHVPDSNGHDCGRFYRYWTRYTAGVVLRGTGWHSKKAKESGWEENEDGGKERTAKSKGEGRSAD
jgi:hypothetical protein